MILSFNDCTIDVGAFELRRRQRRIKLEPRVFDVLLHLIEHRDRVVSKHELLDALWPGEAVSDSVLPRCIAAARRAVGDTRTKQRVIQTVHGRGYRFVADLERRESAPDSEEPSAQAPTTPAPAEGAELPVQRFVGREAAMRLLLRQLDHARRGRGSVALVVGEPGIGKTRIWQELATRAGSVGCQVFVGRCYEGDGAPAYWPWVQILRRSTTVAPDSVGGAQSVADLAGLVPELAAAPDAPAPAPIPDSPEARFRLYDAVVRHLVAVADDSPLVIVLDDLHWADSSSLGLLRFLSGQIVDRAVLVVGTYRDVDVRRGHPLSEVLGSLARDGQTQRIALDGFTKEEIADFVTAEVGEAPGQEVAQRLFEMTEGNPFFLKEIVQLLAEEHDVATVSVEALGTLVLPQGIRDVLGRRLSALSDECNQLLRAAAVLGRSFSTGVLTAMLDSGDARADEAYLEWLGEALDAGAVIETGHGRYAFVHALTRQTLYDELRAPQRILLHRRAAVALEAALPPDAPERLAELAHHFFEAAPGGDVERAIDYAVAAGEFAHGQCAYDEAAQHYDRALDALELLVPVPNDRRIELRIRAGTERFIAGHRDDAHDQLYAAAQSARQAGRPDLMARAAIGLFGFGEMGYPHAAEHVALLQESLDAIAPDDVVSRARLLSRLSGTTLDSITRRAELADEALGLARACDDPLALRDALGASWWASLGPDRIERRFEIADELERLSDRTDDGAVALMSLENKIGAFLILGRGQEAADAITAYRKRATELRIPLFVFMGMMFEVSWLMNTGALDDADRLREEALAYGTGRIAFAPLAIAGQLQWSLSWRRRSAQEPNAFEGRSEELLSYLRDRGLETIFTRAIRSRPSGRPSLTGEELDEIDVDRLERDEHWLLALGILTDAAYDEQHVALMEKLFEMLWPYRGLMLSHDLVRAVSGSVWACLGELATGLGRLDDAVQYYQDAVAFEESALLRAAAHSSRFGLARAHLMRGAPGDRERGAALAESVLQESAVAPYHLSEEAQRTLQELLER